MKRKNDIRQRQALLFLGSFYILWIGIVLAVLALAGCDLNDPR